MSAIVADLNYDNLVDCGDLILLTDRWLAKHILLKADLDRNGFVDLGDFALMMGQNWLEDKLLRPLNLLPAPTNLVATPGNSPDIVGLGQQH